MRNLLSFHSKVTFQKLTLKVSMKGILLLCYCFLVLPVFSQNKISEKELKRYEWLVYNKNVADSSEIFFSDTLLLVKLHELESFKEIIRGHYGQMQELYPRSWQIHFSQIDLETKDKTNEFYIFFVELQKASRRRLPMAVDSLTYQLLLQDPNAPVSERSPLSMELAKMQDGDLIQILDSIHNQFYYIKKTTDQLQVLTTLKTPSIYEPKDINEGVWTLSKRKQLITFSDDAGGIKFLFRVERIDKIRIRLIHRAIILR